MTAGGETRRVRRPTRPALADLAGVLVPAGTALALAAGTLLPGVGFWDTGEFQTVGPLLGVAHPTGYPAYVLLGWLASLVLAPLGEPASRMNALSALCLAVAAGALAWTATTLTGRRSVAAAAGIGLAATPIAWRLGTEADPHALHLALVGLLLAALAGWERARRRGDPSAVRWLVAVVVVVAVALGNHLLTLLLLPGVGAFILAVDPSILRRRRQILALGGLLLGLVGALYLELPLRAGPWRAPLVYDHPETWAGFWYVVLGLQFGGLLQPPWDDLGSKGATLGALLGSELGGLASLLPAALLATLFRRPRWFLLTAPSALLTWLVAASYVNAAIDRYYAGLLLLAWLWLALLADTLLTGLADIVAPTVGADPRWMGSHPPRAPGSAALRATAATLAGLLLVAPVLATLPARRQATEEGRLPPAGPWLEAALGALAPNAVVVSWWSYSTPLWYAQLVEGRRRDLLVIDDRTRLDEGLGDLETVIDRYLGRRPVYAIRIDPGELATLQRDYLARSLADPLGDVLQILARRRTAAPGQSPTSATPSHPGES